ncbi:MAG: hypothetical protein U0T07_11375 [Chitinophagales bacterium]
MITVKNRILDSATRRPMNNVNVFISDSNGNEVSRNGLPNIGRASDKNGQVIIPVANESDFVTYSFVGYQKLTIPGVTAQKKSNIIMRTVAQDLPETEIKYVPRYEPTADKPTISNNNYKAGNNKKTWLIIGGVVGGLAIVGLLFYAIKNKK